MNLSDEWRILPDKYCIILEHLTPVKDRQTGDIRMEWQTYGYYSRIEHLERSIGDYIARDAVAQETLKGFVKAFHKGLDRLKIEDLRDELPVQG